MSKAISYTQKSTNHEIKKYDKPNFIKIKNSPQKKKSTIKVKGEAKTGGKKTQKTTCKAHSWCTNRSQNIQQTLHSKGGGQENKKKQKANDPTRRGWALQMGAALKMFNSDRNLGNPTSEHSEKPLHTLKSSFFKGKGLDSIPSWEDGGQLKLSHTVSADAK